MGLLIVLIITEIFTPVVLRQHFYTDSKAKYSISMVIHVILSLWVWILFFETLLTKAFLTTQSMYG